MGQIIDGSIAYITLKGDDPTEQHTHEHNHLFIVVKGEAKVLPDNEEVIISENEAFWYKGEFLIPCGAIRIMRL